MYHRNSLSRSYFHKHMSFLYHSCQSDCCLFISLCCYLVMHIFIHLLSVYVCWRYANVSNDNKKPDRFLLVITKTDRNPFVLSASCFILWDACYPLKVTSSYTNQIAPDNCLVHLLRVFIPVVENNKHLRSPSKNKTVNAVKREKKKRKCSNRPRPSLFNLNGV